VQWLLDELAGSEIKYKTKEEKDLAQLQGIRTVLLYDFDWFLSSASNDALNGSDQITGKATLEKGQESPITKIALIALGIIIIIVLLTYYLVFLKTETFYEKDVITDLEMQEKNVLSNINLNNASAEESSALGNKAKNVSKLSLNSVNPLIQQAYEELKLGNIESASQVYSVALSVYAQAKPNMVSRLRVNFKMNSLRADILEAKKTKDLYT